MKNLLFLLCAVALLAGCSSAIDPTYITTRNWVYESGYRIDSLNVLDFKGGTFVLGHDTILTDGKAKAVVTGLFKGDNILEIKSLSGQEGKYLDEVEYTR